MIGQVIDHVAAQVIAHRVGVPNGAGQQVLRPVRARLTGMLGERPAIRSRQSGQQPEHKRPNPPTRLDPPKPGPDPLHQFVETTPPSLRVYAVARGHREIFCSPYNSGSSSGGRATRGNATPPDHELRLEY
jgi:hypothetical protein